jgi:hypothetical protein
MYEWTHTTSSSATPDQVWPLYAQVSRWLDWDAGLVDVTLQGDFAVGSSGTLTVEGQPPLTYVLTAVDEHRRFTDVTEIPGVATLTFDHLIEATDAGSSITHTVRIEGPAADDLGPMVTSDTPEAMERLAELAARS